MGLFPDTPLFRRDRVFPRAETLHFVPGLHMIHARQIQQGIIHADPSEDGTAFAANKHFPFVGKDLRDPVCVSGADHAYNCIFFQLTGAAVT